MKEFSVFTRGESYAGWNIQLFPTETGGPETAGPTVQCVQEPKPSPSELALSSLLPSAWSFLKYQGTSSWISNLKLNYPGTSPKRKMPEKMGLSLWKFQHGSFTIVGVDLDAMVVVTVIEEVVVQVHDTVVVNVVVVVTSILDKL